MILGSVLLVVKRAVPEIKAKQTGLLVLQSIGSLVWLASLLVWHCVQIRQVINLHVEVDPFLIRNCIAMDWDKCVSFLDTPHSIVNRVLRAAKFTFTLVVVLDVWLHPNSSNDVWI